MTPQARVQAAIEVLDAVIAAARGQGASADRIIADFFRARRYMGSGDRRAVRELAYGAIRACGEIPASGRAAMLRLTQGDADLAALFDGSRHAPSPIAPGEPVAEAGIAPRWLEQRLIESGIAGQDAAALLDRAPLDVRINALRSAPDLPLAGEPLPVPGGLRFPFGTPVEQWDAYKSGAIEVQDAGSQLTCTVVAAQPGDTVIDLCAGAGGKTLALAAAMSGSGRLIACDVDRARLARLAPRAERAGAGNIEERLLGPGHEDEALADLVGKADAVLVDAPCSGVQMAWAGYFTACAVALLKGIGNRAFALRLPAVSVAVLAGNIVRNTLLVGLEGAGRAPGRAHGEQAQIAGGGAHRANSRREATDRRGRGSSK